MNFNHTIKTEPIDIKKKCVVKPNISTQLYGIVSANPTNLLRYRGHSMT